MSKFDDAILKGKDWLTRQRVDIFQLLPFNPLVAKKAFDTLLYEDEKLQSWKDVTRLFDADPALVGRFFQNANRRLRENNKAQREVRDFKDAVSILGIESTKDILEKSVSDEICDHLKKIPYVEVQQIWKESWAMAHAGRRLSREWQLPEDKGHYIGLLCDLGLILMANFYKKEYFEKADPLFAPGCEDRYENKYGTRVQLETAKFGISHNELGCWLLNELGLDKSYSLSALNHEEFRYTDLFTKEEQIAAISNRVAKHVMLETRHARLTKESELSEDELDEQLDVVQKSQKMELSKILHDSFFVARARPVLKEIESLTLAMSQDITGSIELIEQPDYLRAITDVQGARLDAIRKLVTMYADEIVPSLPQPVALPYFEMTQKNCSNTEVITNSMVLVENFTRFMISATLGSLKTSCRSNLSLFNGIVENILSNHSKKEYFLSGGDGIRFIRTAIDTYREHDLASKFFTLPHVIFFIENSQKIFDLCAWRKNFKTRVALNAEAIDNFMNKATELLRNWASLRIKLQAVTTNRYDSFEDKVSADIVDLCGHEEIRLKRPSTVKRDKPLVTGDKGVLLFHGTAFHDIANYFIYKTCEVTREKQIYMADKVWIERRRDKQQPVFKLKSYSKDIKSPDIFV